MYLTGQDRKVFANVCGAAHLRLLHCCHMLPDFFTLQGGGKPRCCLIALPGRGQAPALVSRSPVIERDAWELDLASSLPPPWSVGRPVISDNKYSLILRQLDFFLFGCAIEGDGVFIDAFDFPAFLGIDPGIGFGFVRATHAAYDAVAQADAQVLQRDALQNRLEEALHDDAFGFFTWNAAHH